MGPLPNGRFSWLINGGDPNHLQVLGCSSKYIDLGGGFTYLLFSPLLGEMIQVDEHIFQVGGSTTN